METQTVGGQTTSQAQQIRNYLEKGNKLTPLEALNLFGCFRLSARIHDIKESGCNINTEIIEVNGKKVAQYSMHLQS